MDVINCSIAVATLRQSQWAGFLVAEADQLQHDPATCRGLLAAPALQVFVERVFSLRGLLSAAHWTTQSPAPLRCALFLSLMHICFEQTLPLRLL